MKLGTLARFAVVGAAGGLVLISALAATNAVPATNAEREVSAITVDQMRPKPDCNGIAVTVLITGAGTVGAATISSSARPR